MRSRVLLLLLLCGWGLSVAGLVWLVERTDAIERQFQTALTDGGELGTLVDANPLEARRFVERLWIKGLAAAARERDGGSEFERAERLSLVIEEHLGDPSLPRFSEWYEQRGSSGAKKVMQIEALLQEAEAAYLRDAMAAASHRGRKALEAARSLGDGWSELRALHVLGDTAWMSGDVETGRKRYRELRDRATELGSRERETAAINNLAAIDQDEGNLREAAAGYRRGLDLARRHGLPDLEGFALLYLGHLFHQLGLYERSVGYFQQAEDAFEGVGRLGLQAAAAGNRGASLQLLEKTKEALAAYRRSLALASAHGDDGSRLTTLLHIAELLGDAGDSGEALAAVGQVLALTRGARGRDSLLVRWGALITAGDLHLEAGGQEAAGRAYTEAAEVVQDVGTELEVAETLRRRARLALAEGHTDRAIEALEAAVSRIETLRAGPGRREERARFLATRRSIYEDLAWVHLAERRDPEKAFEFLERLRARALLDSLEAGVSVIDGAAGGVDVVLSGVAEPEPLARVVAAIEPGAILIHYTVTSRWLAVLILNSEGLVSWSVKDMEERDLNRLVRIFGGDTTASFPLTEGWTELYSDAQRNLSYILLEPAGRHLVGARTAVIVPDGILFAVPWAALRGGGRSQYLGESHELVLEPSASAFVRLRERESRTSGGPALVIAKPDASQRPLPETEIEARELVELFVGSRVLMGEEASESAVRRQVGQYDIVHFATHARVDSVRPLQSSLLLTGARGALEESLLAPLDPEDGVLTGYEVLELPLRTGALVTLAACETVGVVSQRGEGVVGLARAFLESGASSVVATLWPVEDRATRELMGRFYRELASGSTAAGALSKAQTAMARGSAGESRRYPYYWAGFVLIGDGR